MNTGKQSLELPSVVPDAEGRVAYAAGLMGERDLWAVLATVADVLHPYHANGMAHGDISPHTVVVSPKGFALLAAEKKNGNATPEDDVWQTGALLYYLALGLEVFGGNGQEYQTTETPLPIIRNEWTDLSRLVKDMLNCSPDERPSMAQLSEVAHEHLARPWPEHPARSVNPTHSANGATDEWESLWPDEF